MVTGLNGYSAQDIFRQEAMRKAQAFAQQGQQVQQGSVQQTAGEESIMTQQRPAESDAYGSTDGKDDGKIGFWKSLGYMAKGAGKFLGNLVGFEWNADGSYKGWSAGKALKNVAIGVGIAAACVIGGPVVGAIIAGVGVWSAAKGLVKSGYKFFTADTDAEAKLAAEGMGSNTVALGLSVVGAKAAMKSYNPTGNYSGVKGTYNAMKDSVILPYKKAWSGAKTTYNAYKAGGWSTVKTTVVEQAKAGWATAKTNWNNATKTKTVAENHADRVSKYDKEIKQLETQAKQAKDAGNKGLENSLNKKIKRLNEQKTTIEKAYRDIDSETSFSNAQSKLNKLEEQIAQTKRQVETSTNSRVKVKQQYELAKMEQQLDVYKSVIQQKTTEARNIRAEIERIDKLTSEQKTAEVMAKRAELVQKQKDMNFNLPEKAQHETFTQNATESAKKVVKAQEAVDKAQKEFAAAEKAYKKFDVDDVSDAGMTAGVKYYNAKAKLAQAQKELSTAKIDNTSNQTLASASSGADYVGAFTSKAGAFESSFRNLYGSSNIPLVGGKRVPFTNVTVPTTFAPKSYMILSANPWINSQVGRPSLDEIMLSEMGLTPEQIAAYQQAQQPGGQSGQAATSNGQVSLAEWQALDTMMKYYM